MGSIEGCTVVGLPGRAWPAGDGRPPDRTPGGGQVQGPDSCRARVREAAGRPRWFEPAARRFRPTTSYPTPTGGMSHPASGQSTMDHAEAGYVQPYPAGYLRSYADIVTILPALPAGWTSGKARGLRVRAVTPSISSGGLPSVVLHALATCEVTIDVPGDGQVCIRRRVSLQAGATVTVVAPWAWDGAGPHGVSRSSPRQARWTHLPSRILSII